MNKIKNLTVFCGSRYGDKEIYRENAEKLGKMLAENNVSLVFGGGRFGTMGTVAKGVLENGGNIIPVSYDDVWELESSQMFESEFTGKVYDYTKKVAPIMAKDMAERKKIMMDKADAFCILPGSIGTYDELFGLLCSLYLNEYQKPCIIFDEGDYWQAFKMLIDNAIATKFAKPMIRDLYTFVDSVDDVLPVAQAYYQNRAEKIS